MTALVVTLIVFIAVGAIFLAANLLLGKLVRPNRPSPEKGEVYECGEPPIGSAWIQFDLRFYVVALLFVIFDVELAFFFPWAVVFGSANQLAQDATPIEQRLEIARQFSPAATSVPAPEIASAFAQFATFDERGLLGLLGGKKALLVLSGLVLWKSVQFGLLRELLGGYEGARLVHFFAMAICGRSARGAT